MFRDRDGDCAALLPVFCLYQSYVKDENLDRSALGLIYELSSHPEVSLPLFSLPKQQFICNQSACLLLLVTVIHWLFDIRKSFFSTRIS